MATLAAPGMMTPAFAGTEDKRLNVSWIDVEGGATTVLVTPAGESLPARATASHGGPAQKD